MKYFVEFNLFVAYRNVRKARIWNEIEKHDRVINRREIDSLPSSHILSDTFHMWDYYFRRHIKSHSACSYD